MRGAHAGEALGLGFHHRAEGVAAVGALLLQVGENGVRFTYSRFVGEQLRRILGRKSVPAALDLRPSESGWPAQRESFREALG